MIKIRKRWYLKPIQKVKDSKKVYKRSDSKRELQISKEDNSEK